MFGQPSPIFGKLIPNGSEMRCIGKYWFVLCAEGIHFSLRCNVHRNIQFLQINMGNCTSALFLHTEMP